MFQLLCGVLVLAVVLFICKYLLSKKTAKILAIVIAVVVGICAIGIGGIYGYAEWDDANKAEQHLDLLKRYEAAITDYAKAKAYTLDNVDSSSLSEEDKTYLKSRLKPGEQIVNKADVTTFADGWRTANNFLYSGIVSGSKDEVKTAVHLEKPISGVSDVQVISLVGFISSSDAVQLVKAGYSHSWMFHVYNLDGSLRYTEKHGWTKSDSFDLEQFNRAESRNY